VAKSGLAEKCSGKKEIMFNDYSKSTKEYRNPVRLEDIQEQQRELQRKKEVVASVVATIMIWHVGQPYIAQEAEMHMHL
jgi:hypothetical protein